MVPIAKHHRKYLGFRWEASFIISHACPSAYPQPRGFLVNYQKSVLLPTQTITFLEFQINSEEMTIALPKEKLTSVQKEAAHMLNVGTASGRQLASLLGTFS